MKKVFIGFMIFLTGKAIAATETFEATLELLAAINITEVQALAFPDTEAGTAGTLVVAPADATAAVFSATGSASANIAVSVGDINMTDGTDNIPVATWVFGGNLVDGGDGNNGTGSFDGTGNIADMRVGATATLGGTEGAGSYAGTATFTVVYN